MYWPVRKIRLRYIEIESAYFLVLDMSVVSLPCALDYHNTGKLRTRL